MGSPGAPIQNLFSVQGRTAVVTGGAKGVGAMITTALVKAGAHVIVISRSADHGKAFAEELSKFATASSSTQFPLDKPLPLLLIRKITEFRVRESMEEDAKWRTGRKSMSAIIS